MPNRDDRRLTNVGFWETVGELFHDLGIVPMQHALERLHATTNLPWWGCIVGGAVGLRILVLPLRLYGLQQSLLLGRAKMDILPQIPKLRALHDAQGEFNRAATRAWLTAAQTRNTHPFRPWTPLMLHLPLIVATGGAIRKMSAFPVLGLITTGTAVAGWETGGIFGGDLGVTNGWLTAVVVASNVGTIEWIFRRGHSSENNSKPPQKRGLYWIMHSVNVVGAWILSLLPVAINLFVLVNNGLAILEGSLLRSKWITARLAQRIPPLPNTIYTPFTHK